MEKTIGKNQAKKEIPQKYIDHPNLKKLERKYGKIYIYNFDDKFTYLKTPDKNTIGEAILAMDFQEGSVSMNPIKITEAYLNNCIVDGEDIKDNDDAIVLGSDILIPIIMGHLNNVKEIKTITERTPKEYKKYQELKTLENSHGDVFILEYKNEYCIIKKPSRQIIGRSIETVNLVENDMNPVLMGEMILIDSFVGGSLKFRTDDEYILAAAISCNTLRSNKVAELVGE